MKIRILAAFIVASAIAAPAFAGTDAPALTRAQVRAELVQLASPPVQEEPVSTQSVVREADAFATIEKLAQLHAKGILSDEEFAAKKAELLSRL